MAMKSLVAVKAASVKEEEVTVLTPLQSAPCSLAIVVFALESMSRAFFLAHPFEFIIPETSTILETLSLILAMLAACLVIVKLSNKVRSIGKDKCSKPIRFSLSKSANKQ